MESKNLDDTNTNLDKIKQKIDEIKPALARLKWDKEHDQLNPGKVPYFESLKKEYEVLLKQLKEAEESEKSKESEESKESESGPSNSCLDKDSDKDQNQDI